MTRIIETHPAFDPNGDPVKYFFLSEGWTTGRIWEFGGLWNERAWNRPPYVERQPLYIQENGENLWLYKAEDSILMLEVMPKSVVKPTIGQVVLKRLLSAEQVVDRLCLENVFHPPADSLPTHDSETALTPKNAPKNASEKHHMESGALTIQQSLSRLVHTLTPFKGNHRPVSPDNVKQPAKESANLPSAVSRLKHLVSRPTEPKQTPKRPTEKAAPVPASVK